ncbi:MAG TPA: RodZ domain-containing protein [Candidatus Tumulicola sp.]|jgi:cytoskeletal protein RodZ
MPALGERFRAAREARGLSLSEVSEQIRIRSVYLAAIEEERWSAIGAPVYVRGFLRTYARYLALDPEEIVAEFNADTGTPSREPESAPEPASRVRPSKRGSLVVWIAALVAVLLVAFVVYNELTMRRETASSVAAASSEPSPLPSITASGEGGTPAAGPAGASASPSPAVEPNSLALVFSAPTWLRVTVDGSVSMEGTFPAGTTKTFHGRKALVRVGNAGGVEIYVDGKNVGKLGKSGDVVERAFTL